MCHLAQSNRSANSIVQVAALFILGITTSTWAEADSHWNQWRGPKRTGATEPVSSGWPQTLNGHLQQQWKQTLEPSYSGPVVMGDLVYTTETVDERLERVTAFNRNTGESVWRQEWQGAMKVPFFARANGSWIRSTPAVDDTFIYVGGIRDRLVAMDRLSGKIAWEKDCVAEFSTPVPTFGFVSSPIVDASHVYVQAAGSVLKLDKRTGKLLWRSMQDGGGMNGSAFSSPMLTEIGGSRQLIVQTREALAGIRADDGSVAWSQEVPAFRGMNILTPVMWNQQIFTSSYGGKSYLFEPQQNGTVSTKWTHKAQAYMSTPVVVGNHAFVQLRNRRFTCIDLTTGDSKWTTSPFKAQYWSMISQGDRILALDDLGNLRLIRANVEEFEWIDEMQISDQPTWAHIANDGSQIFVRHLEGVSAYRFE